MQENVKEEQMGHLKRKWQNDGLKCNHIHKYIKCKSSKLQQKDRDCQTEVESNTTLRRLPDTFNGEREKHLKPES